MYRIRWSEQYFSDCPVARRGGAGSFSRKFHHKKIGRGQKLPWYVCYKRNFLLKKTPLLVKEIKAAVEIAYCKITHALIYCTQIFRVHAYMRGHMTSRLQALFPPLSFSKGDALGTTLWQGSLLLLLLSPVIRTDQETIKGTERPSPIYTLFHR